MSGGRAGKGLVGEAAAKEGNRLRMGSYKELEGRLSRQQSMRDVAQGMALQKELMVRRRLPLSPPGERERERERERVEGAEVRTPLPACVQGKGHKRKLREKNDETGTKETVYRWKTERKK